MDDKKAYSAFSIPQRAATPPASGRGGYDARLFTAQRAEAKTEPASDPRFAEIEIRSNPNRTADYDKALRFFSSLTPAQPLEQKAVDPIRQRFFEMRSLVSDRPFARDDSDHFYRQAKFMADFEDDYAGDARLQMFFPYYQHMGYEQLRTYFTWRTRVRQGELSPTYVSYIFLYIYELLNGVGVGSPADGLNKLVEVWKTLLQYAPALENYLPKWLKDYHIYYDVPQNFVDFAVELGIQKYFPELFMSHSGAGNALEIWNSLSDYKVAESGFFKADNEQLTADCFEYVVAGIRELLDSQEISLGNLFIYQYGRRRLWYPFSQALFYPRGSHADRKVDLLGIERYSCKDNRWSAHLPIYYSSREHMIGCILRKTESCLRLAYGYKYKLRPEPCAFYRSSATPIVFDQVIEKAVAEFYRDLNKTVVTVDSANLKRIRDEAKGTQGRLIVPESMESLPPPPPPPSPQLNAQPSKRSAEDSPWTSLKDALTRTELEALTLALTSGADVKAFADANGIMLEVLADGINEKAADCIGDSILEAENGIVIFDEYRKNIEDMVVRN